MALLLRTLAAEVAVEAAPAAAAVM